jgi:hypothetical protein
VPATTITISSEQRDGLYELVRNHLGSAGDLVDLLEQEKDWGKAEQLGVELAEDIRLMQDLGWGEDEGREGVELTMAPLDLTEVLNRLTTIRSTSPEDWLIRPGRLTPGATTFVRNRVVDADTTSAASDADWTPEQTFSTRAPPSRGGSAGPRDSVGVRRAAKRTSRRPHHCDRSG